MHLHHQKWRQKKRSERPEDSLAAGLPLSCLFELHRWRFTYFASFTKLSFHCGLYIVKMLFFFSRSLVRRKKMEHAERYISFYMNINISLHLIPFLNYVWFKCEQPNLIFWFDGVHYHSKNAPETKGQTWYSLLGQQYKVDHIWKKSLLNMKYFGAPTWWFVGQE